MKDLDTIVDRIEAELNEKDQVREVALKSTRTIVRLAGAAIRGMHRGEDVASSLDQAREETRRLASLLADHSDLWHGGSVEGALQEVAEAAIVHSLLGGGPLPDPRDLGVTSPAYLLGLADAVGELRRFALDRLRAGDVEAAAENLQKMEEIFDALLRFDHPNAIVPLRHKQDVARGLLERTRGELAVAAHGTALERRLRELTKKL
ncbi:MAG TPA: translin family protein [Thermoplasmata archaeon]|jgi:translin|nr:translin family protein [Thermoplasmata archaeon]